MPATARQRAHRNMFTLSGWLFADMFLAMTMIFLIASAVGTYIPATHAQPPTPRLIGMDTTPVTINFTVDVNGLLANDPAVVAQVKSQVQSQLAHYLTIHKHGQAALVLTFGGGTDDGIDNNEAQNVNAVLQAMGRQQYHVFARNDTVYRNYVDRSVDFGIITIQVFFFLFTN